MPGLVLNLEVRRCCKLRILAARIHDIAVGEGGGEKVAPGHMPLKLSVCATLYARGLFTLANGIGSMSGSSESGRPPVKKLKQSALTFHNQLPNRYVN